MAAIPNPAARSDLRVEARNALVQSNLDWARRVAKSVYMRLRIPTVEWSDYVQAATVGLIESADRYDPSHGVPFQAFAIRRVRGEVFNSVRGLLKVPPTGWTYDALSERSESLNDLDLEPVERMIQLVTGLGTGLLLESGSLLMDAVAACQAYGAVEQSQIKQSLDAAMQDLPERERFIIRMHYLHHTPFVEIAKTLSLTKGRISQLHSRAILKLRGALQGCL